MLWVTGVPAPTRQSCHIRSYDGNLIHASAAGAGGFVCQLQYSPSHRWLV